MSVGEKILVIQSAEPEFVFKALERLEQQPAFTNPSYTIFCRNRPEILGSFQGNPLFQQVVSHSEARGSLESSAFLEATAIRRNCAVSDRRSQLLEGETVCVPAGLTAHSDL